VAWLMHMTAGQELAFCALNALDGAVEPVHSFDNVFTHEFIAGLVCYLFAYNFTR